MENKNCIKCNTNVNLDDFPIDKRNKSGHTGICKQCTKEQNTKKMSAWRKNNPIKVKEDYLNYRKENILYLKKTALERQKQYRKNPIYKLKEAIRNNIKKSMIRNGISKTTRTTQILGCSFNEFRIHIESQFQSWMSWDNRGLYNGQFNFGWDLDHIVPISSATTINDIIRLNHYSNFQPLCSHTNRDIKKDN